MAALPEAQQGLTRPLALHVGGLNAATTEIDLYHFFSEIAVSVSSLRIIRDEKDKAARYAYVNFISPEDAEKALLSLNYKQFKGQEILLSRSIPASHRNQDANLFISNLPAGCSSEQLSNAFSPYGTIISARVNVDASGQRRSYGYVQFESVESAARAIEATQQEIPIAGAKNLVKAVVFKPSSERPRQLTNVFVRNFPVAKGQQGFEDFVKQYGNVTSVFFKSDVLQLDGSSPSPTGFGFANYATHEEAIAALKEMDGKEVDGFQIQAFEAKAKADRQRQVQEQSRQFSLSNANVYIKHIPNAVSAQEVEAFFKSFGDVISFKLQVTEAGVRTGVAYVQYKNQEDAQKAIAGAIQRHYYAAIHQPRAYRTQALTNQRVRPANYTGGLRRQQPYRQQPPRQMPYYPQHLGGMYPQARMYPRHMPYPPQQFQQQGGQQQQQQQPRRYNRNQNGEQQPRENKPRNNQNKPRRNNKNNNAAPAQGAEDDIAQQRQKLGEELFWKVQTLDNEQAPKITGMLLEMKPQEVKDILADQALLEAKVKEAQTILQQTPQ
eukprot:UN01346